MTIRLCLTVTPVKIAYDWQVSVWECYRFQTQYGVRAQTALPYAMNSEFSRVMATQMVGYECRKHYGRWLSDWLRQKLTAVVCVPPPPSFSETFQLLHDLQWH